jgi:hypothetical protein
MGLILLGFSARSSMMRTAAVAAEGGGGIGRDAGGDEWTGFKSGGGAGGALAGTGSDDPGTDARIVAEPMCVG